MTFIAVHPQYTNLKQSRSPRRVVHPKKKKRATNNSNSESSSKGGGVGVGVKSNKRRNGMNRGGETITTPTRFIDKGMSKLNQWLKKKKYNNFLTGEKTKTKKEITKLLAINLIHS